MAATYVKLREGGRIVSMAVIVAVAVNTEGREILGITVMPSEAETFWSDFLRSLTRRGLRRVQQVIGDAHEDLKAAPGKVPGAGCQRVASRPCSFSTFFWAAWERATSRCSAPWSTPSSPRRTEIRFTDVAERMDGGRARRSCLQGLRRVPALEVAEHQPPRARQQRDQVADQRRRDLPHRKALLRLFGALMLEQNDEWAVSRRYMPVEKLTAICNDPDRRQ